MAGAQSITLVSSVEEAFALKETHPDALLMGKVKGTPAPNSHLQTLIDASMLIMLTVPWWSIGKTGDLECMPSGMLEDNTIPC